MALIQVCQNVLSMYNIRKLQTLRQGYELPNCNISVAKSRNRKGNLHSILPYTNIIIFFIITEFMPNMSVNVQVMC